MNLYITKQKKNMKMQTIYETYTHRGRKTTGDT